MVRLFAALLIWMGISVSAMAAGNGPGPITIVASCGAQSLSVSPPDGQHFYMDQTGKLCVGASFSGTVSTSATAAASPPTYTAGAQPFSQNLSGGLRTQISLAGTDIGLGQQTKALSVPVVLPSDQTVAANIAQINGVTPLMGNGVTGTGSQRVTVASDNTPFPVKIDQTTPGTTNGIQVNAALPAGTNLLGKMGIDQTTPGTTNGVQVNAALPAGTNVIGQVIGQDTQTTTTPTVTASAYSASNCVGGFNAVTISRANGSNGLIQNVILMSKTGLTPTLTVYLFNANPSSSTCTDKSTFTLNSADLPKLIAAPFALTLAVPQGSTPSTAEIANMARPFIAGGSSGSGVQTIYFALVAGGAFTPASTSELIVNIGADLN